MGTPHKHAEVIKAWADGVEIQWRKDGLDYWRDIKDPLFDPLFQYRVKPQPVKSIGYRRYLKKLVGGGPALVANHYQFDNFKWCPEEGDPLFISWIDKEWQYELVPEDSVLPK